MYCAPMYALMRILPGVNIFKKKARRWREPGMVGFNASLVQECVRPCRPSLGTFVQVGVI